MGSFNSNSEYESKALKAFSAHFVQTIIEHEEVLERPDRQRAGSSGIKPSFRVFIERTLFGLRWKPNVVLFLS